MPEFANPFSGGTAGKLLTHSELVRAIRFMIAAESTDNEIARKVLRDITDEEKEHAGEFRHLLTLLAPGDEEHYADGCKEADNYLKPLIKMQEEQVRDNCEGN